MEELSLQDIVAILKRRKKYFFATSITCFVIAALFTLFWSNYRSQATVQIEQSEISVNVTTPLGASPMDMLMALADQRISQVKQVVTSMGSLAEIIAKYNLYPDLRDNTPISVIADKMRKKIKVDFISSTTANPAAASKESVEQLSAIAFTLSFDYSDPETARKITDELVTRFQDEDLNQRHKQAQATSEFLGAQIAQLETDMAEQEKKTAAFRAAHGESGPSALMFNEQAAANTTMALQNLDSQIASNEGTQGSLRSQLAVVDPYSRVIADGQILTTPETQLKALKAQYATLSAQYGPDHPDVLKAKHQIAALQAEVGKHVNTHGALKAQIRDTQTNLDAAKKTGGEDSPDTIALQHKLDSLQAQLANSHDDNSAMDIKQDADNPAYLALVAQLSSAEEQHKALIEQRNSLVEQQTKYQKMIAEDPDIEKEMAQLTRDYDSAQLRYRELKEKKMAADMAQQIEDGRMGQRLIVIDPADTPTKTHPSQLLLLLAGIVASIVAGLGAVAFAEIVAESIHGPHHLMSLVGAMPMVTVPYIALPAGQEHSLKQEILTQLQRLRKPPQSAA